MGNLSKLLPTSTADGGGSDASRIGQLVTMLAIVAVLMSSIPGPAAAASATGVRADDYTDGQIEQAATINSLDITSEESITVTVDASGIDYSSITIEDISVSHPAMSVTAVTEPANGLLEFDLSSSENLSGEDVTISIDGEPLTVNDEGDGTVSVEDASGGLSVVDSFEYSLSYAETHATLQIGSISTDDATPNWTYLWNARLVIEDATDNTEVVNTTEFSETYSTDLDPGTYTVRHTADHYESSSQAVTFGVGETKIVDLYYERTTVDYEFEVVDGDTALESFDISVFRGAEDGDGVVDVETDIPVASATVGENDSNTVTFAALDDGKDYTVLVEHGQNNSQEFTYEFTADESADEDGDGVVSQTLDVAGDDVAGFVGGDATTSDILGFIVGGLIIFVFAVGTIFIVLWTKNGLKYSNL